MVECFTWLITHRSQNGNDVLPRGLIVQLLGNFNQTLVREVDREHAESIPDITVTVTVTGPDNGELDLAVDVGVGVDGLEAAEDGRVDSGGLERRQNVILMYYISESTRRTTI